jgi:2-oxoglutarate ferredoxin oxidoreductase subunit alpha
MSEPFVYPARPIDRGKVLSAAELERLGGFARYGDPDGDGIGWRTLPGTDHPSAAYFTRGSGHDEQAAYSERPEVYERNLGRLARKLEGARPLLPAPVLSGTGSSKIGIVAVGSSDPAVREAMALLAAERGIAVDFLRVRAFPFAAAVREFVERHDRIYVVEQDRDAQLRSLLQLDLPPALGPKLRSVAHATGMPLDARSVADELVALEARS